MNGMFLNNLKSPAQIYREEGILFYPGFLEGEELARLHASCEFVMGQFREDLEQTDPVGAARAVVMAHLNHPRWHREHGEHWKTIMEMVADPRCLGPVEQIFSGRSLFRTPNLFFNPRAGTQEGGWHRDHQFLLPDEEAVQRYFDEKSRGKVQLEGIQLQIALIDNDDVEYVPFSAGRYDSPQEYFYRCADGRSHNQEAGMPNAMRVRLRAGDAIIFNAAGLHRGRYHADKPRRTLMLTYTPHRQPMYDALSYQPWMMEPRHLDELSPRAQVYFNDFISVYHDSWKAQ